MPIEDQRTTRADEGLIPLDDLPFAKRVIATLLGKLLTYMGVQHRASFVQGREEGFVSGRMAGHSAGHTAGRAEGIKEGKQTLEIVDRRSKARSAPGVDDNLFDPWAFPIDEPLRARIRADVHAKLPPHKHPTPDQWEMIFSTTPTACVVAGAGSGKSTTLVLRILLLHHYLGFELSSLTVVTFTNMSRADFIKKLTETFAIWGIQLAPQEAKSVVCTFHSKILRFIRGLPGIDRIVPFEFCGGGAAKAEDSAREDDENAMPFETRVSGGQLDLLNAAYTTLYTSDEEFRSLVQILYRLSLLPQAIDTENEQTKKQLSYIRLASRSDASSMDAVESEWSRAGKWPIAGITPTREVIKVHGHPFQVHGKIESLGAHVILLPDRIPGGEFIRPGGRVSLGQELGLKQIIFRAYCDVPVIWLREPDATGGLLEWLADSASIAPGFKYQVSGELAPASLLECFVAAATFIENLGLDVPATVAGMSFPVHDPDRVFFRALAIFWPAFEDHLDRQTPKIMTFNRMFSLFGESSSSNLRGITDATLRSMSHLMIDEFQDISPQIVSWVRATQAEVRRRGAALHAGRRAQHGSLLCVGDDWQSIYGWRGSAPKFFMEFEKEFKSPACTRVMLRENFRSHQHVIDAAEHIVRSAPSIPGKKAIAAGPAAANPVPVAIHDRDDELMLNLVRQHYHAGESVMVLFRRGEDGKTARSQLSDLVYLDSKLREKDRRLKLLTYHRSKGLEADAVFLIGDCIHMTNSPYKNQTYRAAGLGGSNDPTPFDHSQKDEILRLAYVAITRAARHCYWFINASPGAESRPKASACIVANQPYFQDHRKR